MQQQDSVNPTAEQRLACNEVKILRGLSSIMYQSVQNKAACIILYKNIYGCSLKEARTRVELAHALLKEGF